MSTDYAPPSEDEVYDYIEGIPAKLRKCAAAKHNWKMLEWTGYTPSGKPQGPKADPNNAAWVDVTQLCAGQQGCGYKRHFQMGWRRGRLVRTSEYSYSDRNPQLVSPHGISQTDIVVRTEMADTILAAQILRPTVELAPAGATKRALAQGAA